MTFENKMEIIEFFNTGCQKSIQLEQPIDPIFEYHIYKMLAQVELLTLTIQNLSFHLGTEEKE